MSSPPSASAVCSATARLQPIGRPGEPREIANVALFLASDEAAFLTGQAILVGGGPAPGGGRPRAGRGDEATVDCQEVGLGDRSRVGHRHPEQDLPLALRVLGPLVIVSTLAVLGSGVALLLATTGMTPRSWLRAR